MLDLRRAIFLWRLMRCGVDATFTANAFNVCPRLLDRLCACETLSDVAHLVQLARNQAGESLPAIPADAHARETPSDI